VIAAEQASYPIALMCRCLDVSRSGFYAWSTSKPSDRDRTDAELAKKIREIHERSRGTYGSPRVLHELEAVGHKIGHRRVERLMRENGIVGRFPRRSCRTTVRDESHPVADNILNRCFKTDAPNKVWVTDITYIPTGEGWLYLAVMLDLFSRRVVGWSMADHLRTELAMNALEMAIGNRDIAAGLMHHSDRGCQYTSHEYQQALAQRGFQCSMSRAGNCHDNAVAESFFGTLEVELFYDKPIPETRDQARMAIHEYIEVFYNRQRRHSTIGFVSPAEYESLFLNRAAIEAA
jgi:transposase InsO family protein